MGPLTRFDPKQRLRSKYSLQYDKLHIGLTILSRPKDERVYSG